MSFSSNTVGLCKAVRISLVSRSKDKVQVALTLQNVEKKNFFIPQEKRHSMILNINNLIYRLQPNDKELRILASIISSLSKNNY